jgi:hypothetical protein
MRARAHAKGKEGECEREEWQEGTSRRVRGKSCCRVRPIGREWRVNSATLLYPFRLPAYMSERDRERRAREKVSITRASVQSTWGGLTSGRSYPGYTHRRVSYNAQWGLSLTHLLSLSLSLSLSLAHALFAWVI